MAAATARSRWPSPCAVPGAMIDAVDVNERALDPVPGQRRGARRRGPGPGAASRRGRSGRRATTRSGPTRRSGSARRPCTSCCSTWLPRLAPDGVARLVVGKNLGADTLQRWLIDQGYACERAASAKGFRVLGRPASARGPPRSKPAASTPSQAVSRDRPHHLGPAAVEQPAALGDADPEHDAAAGQAHREGQPADPGREERPDRQRDRRQRRGPTCRTMLDAEGQQRRQAAAVALLERVGARRRCRPLPQRADHRADPQSGQRSGRRSPRRPSAAAATPRVSDHRRGEQHQRSAGTIDRHGRHHPAGPVVGAAHARPRCAARSPMPS